MNAITFDTGIVRYNINGVCEVAFNPTDPAFATRLLSAFEELSEKQAIFKEQTEKAAESREILALSEDWDRQVREIVNGVFDNDVCSALFGDMNAYASAGGVPVWCNLLLAIIDQIDEGVAAAQKSRNKKLEKYLEKYVKK